MKTITIDNNRFEKLISVESFKSKKGRFEVGEKISVSNLVGNKTKYYDIITIFPIVNFIDRVRVNLFKLD